MLENTFVTNCCGHLVNLCARFVCLAIVCVRVEHLVNCLSKTVITVVTVFEWSSLVSRLSISEV